ncbi:MAG TPA: isochorismate synthase [Candidatus Dormibacteraeota bacterium]
MAAARDAGHEVMLVERPMPDAVSIAALGRAFDLVSAPGGAALLGAGGEQLDFEPGPVVAAAAALWTRLAARQGGAEVGPAGTGLAAVGGFAFRPDREPAGPWAGFPALLLRVPALAVTRVRGRTYASSALPDAEELLEIPPSFRAPAARQVEVAPARPPDEWTAAVASATRRLAAGEAEKVVLAREVVARADGAVAAASVARALRAAYPACFTYLMTGADGTAFIGASPELLVRRAGTLVTAQPMAGSVARGADEAEDERLAASLLGERFLAEHRVVPAWVAERLAPLSLSVDDPGRPEVVRFTNIQHLATTIRARLREPAPNLLALAGSLHPTPAVGGLPLEPALRLIDELEGFDRGWYAGAVGWIDGRGDGELAVALRCGLLWEDGARLFAGNGILAGADPAAELEETEVKLRALLGALVA